MGLGPKIITCLTVIDAVTISNHYDSPSTDPSNPTNIGSLASSTIFMVVAQDNQLSGNASAGLDIKAKKDDTIHWRATTLSANEDAKVNFTNFVKYSGDNVIDQPQKVSGEEEWTATVRQVSSGSREVYNWIFEILDSSNNLYGYFQWDPSITVE